MPTLKSKRYLATVKVLGAQPAQIHIFSTHSASYSFKLSWQTLNPPSPIVESKVFGPYTNVSIGIEKALQWHYKKFKHITDYDHG